MNNVVCCPVSFLPSTLDPDRTYFSMYSYVEPAHEAVGHIAPTLRTSIRKDGLAPSVPVWDFTSIALAVAAADLAFERSSSPDGWTREFHLEICLCDPGPWSAVRLELESTLRFLTGDFWTLRFLSGGEKPPAATKKRTFDADCVSLLSGGVDSLVGAIDLTSAKAKPLLVSQVVKDDKKTQHSYAQALSRGSNHVQWSYAVKHPEASEITTRGRSLVFFAFAALAASAIASGKHNPVEIVVPENGFISLNVPLSPGRIGSLSTKTTHPIYMEGIQFLFDALGIEAILSFPYRFKTKGELLLECADQDKLADLIGRSSSCGKSARIHMHCGRCVPCMVRRAAFLKAGLIDTTAKGYAAGDLSHSESTDVTAAAVAYLRYKTRGVRRFIGGNLSFALPQERPQFEGVVARGLEELGQLLRSFGLV